MQSEEDTTDHQMANSIPDGVSSTSENPSNSTNKIVHMCWSWKETPSQMFQHPPGSIVGDPSDGWIRYGRVTNKKLEAAYNNEDVTCDLDNFYEVNLTTMKQINKHTRFQRQVQRTVETPKVWCWKETGGLMWKHDPSTIYGHPSDCWIQYDQTVSDLLEQAFQDGEEEVSTSNVYVVNLDNMIQTNEATGIERDVQRVDATADDDDEPPQPAAVTSSSSAVAVANASASSSPKKVWCWKETDGFQWRHDASTIHGDPSNCWVKYDEEANDILEDAFQTQPFGIVSPCEGYNVNLAIMKQVNIATGFERDVQRVDPIENDDDDSDDESEEEQNTLTVRQAEEMETRLRNEMQHKANHTEQRLTEVISAKVKETQKDMENELKLVRTELQETQSELKQTTQERDTLKQDVATMKETLETLKKSVDLLLQNHQEGSAKTDLSEKQTEFDPSSTKNKKRLFADLDEPEEEYGLKKRVLRNDE